MSLRAVRLCDIAVTVAHHVLQVLAVRPPRQVLGPAVVGLDVVQGTGFHALRARTSERQHHELVNWPDAALPVVRSGEDGRITSAVVQRLQDPRPGTAAPEAVAAAPAPVQCLLTCVAPDWLPGPAASLIPFAPP